MSVLELRRKLKVLEDKGKKEEQITLLYMVYLSFPPFSFIPRTFTCSI